MSPVPHHHILLLLLLLKLLLLLILLPVLLLVLLLLLPHHHIPHSVSAPCVALDVEWSRGQLDGELDREGGAQLGLVGSAVLEQRQVWRVEEVHMEGIRC